jgi:formylglycine-generating enzyme required for sulfatase activity
VRLPDPRRSRMVVIGASRYSDEMLPDLPEVGRTIVDLKTALTDPIYGVVAEDHCDMLSDEGDIRLIGRHLRIAANRAEDLLLVYYVGHGLVAGRRHNLYLALHDTEWEEPEFNSLEYDKLRDAVLSSKAGTKVIVLDCCFSGRALSDGMADMSTELISQVEVDGTYVLASAPQNQVALILPGESHTAFTGRLLGLLQDGIPQGPQLLTIDDLYRHLRQKMQAEGLPQPQSRATNKADGIALARNRAFTTGAAVESLAFEPTSVPTVGEAGRVSQGRVARRVYANVQIPIDLMFVPHGNAYMYTDWKWPDVTSDNLATSTLDDFVISKFPITRRQFNVFAADPSGLADTRWRVNPSTFDQVSWDASALSGVDDDDDAPVLVTRYWAIAYCRWLSSRSRMRLVVPTEWHWIRAARGDSHWLFPWGDSFDPGRCSCRGSGRFDVTAVGRFPTGASRYGVEDMVGNAPEWISLTQSSEANLALAGGDSGKICEESGAFHMRGCWANEENVIYYSCDYRGPDYAPSPNEVACFRVCGPCNL